MKKILCVLFVMFLVACSPKADLNADSNADTVLAPTVIGVGEVEEPQLEPTPPEELEEIGQSPAETSESPIKEFSMIAHKWDFEPSTITVNEGDTVRLKITSTDVQHGFRLSEYGINEILPFNTEVVVEFVADKAGEFPFACSVPCGSGHGGMTGKLIVQ